MRHSNKHVDWVNSKGYELEEFGAKKALSITKTCCTWRSKCLPLFTEIRNKFYINNKKTVSMEILDSLRDIGIAIWYGDSGELLGKNKNNACLKTKFWGEKGNKIIHQYFNEVGYECNINYLKESSIIVFTENSTKKLMDLISCWMPRNRYYKLLTY